MTLRKSARSQLLCLGSYKAYEMVSIAWLATKLLQAFSQRHVGGRAGGPKNLTKA